MFKLMFSAFKLLAIVLAILVLGNWIQWDGRTVSDHVRSQMSHARRADVEGTISDWAGSAWESGKKTAARLGAGGEPSSVGEKKAPKARKNKDEDIFQSERQKLRDLIRELNGVQGRLKADRD